MNESNYKWDRPNTFGPMPCPRKSHTAVTFTPKIGNGPQLLIYGGMNGDKLGDIWLLDVQSLTWRSIKPGGNFGIN